MWSGTNRRTESWDRPLPDGKPTFLSETVLVLDGCSNLGDYDRGSRRFGGTCLGFLSQADDTIGDDLFGVEVWQEALGPKNGDRLLDIASEVQTRGRSNVGFDVPEVIGDREFWLTRQRGMDSDEPTGHFGLRGWGSQGYRI